MASTTRILVGRRTAVTLRLCAAEKKTRRASRARRRLPFCRSRAAKLGRSPIFPKVPATQSSPDNKTIAFLSTTTPEDIAKEERKKKKPEGESKSKESEAAKNTVEPKSPEPESEHESDVHVINRAVYRDNDEGYLDPKRHNHIWVLDVPTTSDELTKPKQLTTGELDEADLT